MELTLFQILAAAVCLAVALVGLGLPALLRHSASALSIGNCLAAGCILGGGLLHLLPDAAESHDDTLSLLLLIALHKGLAAFALGMSFLGAGLGRRATVVLGGTFALATPIGVAFGVLLRSSAENSTPSAVCVAAAAGSFVYVALVEVLPRELAHRAARRRTQLAALLTGFAIFAALAVWL